MSQYLQLVQTRSGGSSKPLDVGRLSFFTLEYYRCVNGNCVQIDGRIPSEMKSNKIRQTHVDPDAALPTPASSYVDTQTSAPALPTIPTSMGTGGAHAVQGLRHAKWV
jgi:hypothetical protein